MIDVEQAWQRIIEHAASLAKERQSFLQALHSHLASPVYADADIPARDRAAMDGYAVRSDDLRELPVSLNVVDEVAAGSSRQPPVAAGECVRIFTGANLPPDVDTVVQVEDVDPEVDDDGGTTVRFRHPVTRGQHIFRRGENARAGDTLIPAGTQLNAIHLGLCAAVGGDRVDVYRKPKTAVLTTGAELKTAADSVVAPHEIRDSNGPMLAALLAANHFPLTVRLSTGDDLGSLESALARGLEQSDVLLVAGGVSVGKYDLVPAAIKKIGGKIIYHGVAVKPGKPQLFAMLPNGKFVFGLPGNPLAVMVGMQEFALPALRLLAGCPPARCRPLFRLTLGESIQGKGKRQRHILGRLRESGDGTTVIPVDCSGSADLAAAGLADGAIVVPAGISGVSAGTKVDFRPWRLP